MNKLLVLLSFLLFTTTAFSQITVAISGTITDSSGEGVENITVHIQTDSIGGFEYHGTVQTDADGNYSDSFEVSDEITQGAIYVGVLNCDGSTLAQTTYWFPGNNNPVVDFDYCEMNCSVTVAENSPGNLQATPYGTAPFSYEWSNGETGSSIMPTASGDYCVTITSADDCTSSSCYYYYLEEETCDEYVYISEEGASLSAIENISGSVSYLWSTGETTQSITATDMGTYCVTITYGEDCSSSHCIFYFDNTVDSCSVAVETVQGGTWLAAVTGGTAPFTYTWNTGETTSAIEITEDMQYCVTVIDALNCVATACLDGQTPPLYVSGAVIVSGPDSMNITGIVNLYAIDNEEVINVSSIDFQYSSFHFADLEAGDYIVQAVVDGYLPTYNHSSVWWDEADVLTLENQGMYANISLIALEELAAGPGSISGTVNDSDGFNGQSDSRGENAVEGALIILFDSNDAPVAYAFTDAEGAYTFGNLPYGTYTVYIEIIGLEQVSYTVTLSPDNATVENLDFTVNDNSIVTATRAPLLENSFLSIYPNPVKGELNMNLDLELKGNANVQIINVTGQVIFNDYFAAYQQQKSIDVASLNAGIYVVKITTNEGIIVQQFVKK